MDVCVEVDALAPVYCAHALRRQLPHTTLVRFAIFVSGILCWMMMIIAEF